MMATAVDIQSGDIPYEYYINSLMVNCAVKEIGNFNMCLQLHTVTFYHVDYIVFCRWTFEHTAYYIRARALSPIANRNLVYWTAIK